MAKKKIKHKKFNLDDLPDLIIKWIGTTQSLMVHTVIFLFSFLAHWAFGASFDIILLVLTTIVSLEAIYLAIFIQRSVNQQATRLDDVEESLDDVEENLDDVEESIDAVEESITSTNHRKPTSDHQKLERTLAQIIEELKAVKVSIEKRDEEE